MDLKRAVQLQYQLFSKELCTDYGDDIIRFLKQSEQNRVPMRFISPQIRHREAMVNFIRSVGEYEQLLRATVHLAIYLVDTFMDNHNITDNRLNLVALSCILLASKIEENEPNIPSLSSLNELVHNQYPTSDYAVLEVVLLKFFNWNLIIPTVATFAGYWLLNVVSPEDFLDSLSVQQFFEKRFQAIDLFLEFVDITTTHVKMTNKRPSLVASACLAAARSCIPVEFTWPDCMIKLTGYTFNQLDSTSAELMSWRACLLMKEISSRKRMAFDSGYLTESDDNEDEGSSVQIQDLDTA
ncbi:cyclin-J [Uranotaenia lowii]|uniref:cyclin-J n=1 Tax=Uranotaenia lowii TaxID=190385 RepID=UPI002479839E|nr:cyclin-J [Uranotaenia lowii]